MALLVWAEYRSVPKLKRVDTPPPPIYDLLPTNTSNIILELPLLEPDITIEPIYMYYSTFHWHAMVNGYSGFSPPSYRVLRESMEQFPDDVALAELRRRGVTHVIVHGELYREGDYARVVKSMDSSKDLDFITEVRYVGYPTRLYRLLPVQPEYVPATP
jgi:hypothetical protein